jgi:hypothetical protein
MLRPSATPFCRGRSLPLLYSILWERVQRAPGGDSGPPDAPRARCPRAAGLRAGPNRGSGGAFERGAKLRDEIARLKRLLPDDRSPVSMAKTRPPATPRRSGGR